MAYFVSYENHRDTKAPYVSATFLICWVQLLDGRVVGQTVDTAVPTPVVVGSVSVVLAVVLVVLLVVGDQVIERESVMAGDEVYTLLSLAVFMAINGGAPDEAIPFMLAAARL